MSTSNSGFARKAATTAVMFAALAAAYPAMAQRAAGATGRADSTGLATSVPGTTVNTTGQAPTATTGGLGANSGNVGEASGIAPANAVSPSQTPQAQVSSPAEGTSTSIGQTGVSPSYAAAPNGNFASPTFNGGAQGNETSTVGSGNFTPPATANSLSGPANQNSGFTSTTGGFVNNTAPLNSGATSTTTTLGSAGSVGGRGAAPVQGASPAQGEAPVQGPSPTF